MDIQKIFRLVDEKINMLSEQDIYSVSVALAEIKGSMNLSWTNCTRTRCERGTSTFQKRICKLECQENALRDAVARISGQRANCNRTTNPQACFNALENSAKGMRNKINIIRKQIDATRRQEAQMRVKSSGAAAGGAAAGGMGAPPGGAQGAAI
jgi:hypothetical protein